MVKKTGSLQLILLLLLFFGSSMSFFLSINALLIMVVAYVGIRLFLLQSSAEKEKAKQ